MTLRALFEVHLDPVQANHAVWRPDAIGSALFLISSVIALKPLARSRRHAHVASRSTWICNANLLGSVAFAVSAVASLYEPDGAMVDPVLANGGTFIGAVGFFIAALLVFPRWAKSTRSQT